MVSKRPSNKHGYLTIAVLVLRVVGLDVIAEGVLRAFFSVVVLVEIFVSGAAPRSETRDNPRVNKSSYVLSVQL